MEGDGVFQVLPRTLTNSGRRRWTEDCVGGFEAAHPSP